MRLFLAVDPDRAAVVELDRLFSDVHHALADDARACRWTPARNAHLTLHFLGEVGDALLGRLTGILGGALAVPSFRVALGGLAIFPASGPPRVLSVLIGEGREPLVAIHDELAARIRQAGLPVEDRPFTPHLTLARVRERERRQAGRLRDRVAALAAPAPVGWTVQHVALIRSDLSGPAPRYDTILEIPLARSTPNTAGTR